MLLKYKNSLLIILTNKRKSLKTKKNLRNNKIVHYLRQSLKVKPVSKRLNWTLRRKCCTELNFTSLVSKVVGTTWGLGISWSSCWRKIRSNIKWLWDKSRLQMTIFCLMSTSNNTLFFQDRGIPSSHGQTLSKTRTWPSRSRTTAGLNTPGTRFVKSWAKIQVKPSHKFYVGITNHLMQTKVITPHRTQSTWSKLVNTMHL